jgi:hypothetical protein
LIGDIFPVHVDRGSVMEKKEPKIQETVRDVASGERREFEEPKLEFVEPKLTDHGDLTRVTHGFFGTFVP